MTDFSQVIIGFDGNPIEDSVEMQGNGGIKVDLTLGLAASHALCAAFQDEQNVSGDEKFRRGKLAFEIRDAKELAVKADDIALIKKLIAKLYTPAVVYRAYQMLDPAEK